MSQTIQQDDLVKIEMRQDNCIKITLPNGDTIDAMVIAGKVWIEQFGSYAKVFAYHEREKQ